MGYNSRRPQQVLLLPPKKRKLRLQQLSPKTGSGCFYWALFRDHRHMYTTAVSQKTHKFHLLLYFLKYLNEKSAQTSEYWTTCYCWEVVLQYCAGPYTAIHIIWYTSCIKSNHIFSSLLDYLSLQEVTSLLKWLPSCNELLLLARKSGPDFNKVTLWMNFTLLQTFQHDSLWQGLQIKLCVFCTIPQVLLTSFHLEFKCSMH